jgi:hypothetical protein
VKPAWNDIEAVTRWVCERVDHDDFASIEFDTRDLLDILLATSVKSPRSGKHGRPKQTAEQRERWELGNPVHAAACETIAIEKCFREFYPREQGRHDRALDIAAKRHNIKPRRLIENYLRSRHKIPNR